MLKGLFEKKTCIYFRKWILEDIRHHFKNKLMHLSLILILIVMFVIYHFETLIYYKH